VMPVNTLLFITMAAARTAGGRSTAAVIKNLNTK